MRRPTLFSCLAVVSIAACKRAPAPRYCAQDLSGVWVNATDRAYAYRLRDQGDSVNGKYFHRDSDGGEVPPKPGDDPMLIDLHRTSTALAGTMKTKGASPAGKPCDLDFAMRVSSCQPDALQVVAETSVQIRDDCTRQKEEDGGVVPAQLTEYRWERETGDTIRK
jgi:hypothetical protein